MPTTPTTLIESLSRDPVERALAAQALQVLHNRALPRADQHTRIALLQQALLAHRARPQPVLERRPPAMPTRRSTRHGADPQALLARQRELGRGDAPALPMLAPTPAAPAPAASAPASTPVEAATHDRGPALRASTLTLRRR